jgi:hypothetical protein
MMNFCFLKLEEHLSVNGVEHISTANEWVNQSSNGCWRCFTSEQADKQISEGHNITT